MVYFCCMRYKILIATCLLLVSGTLHAQKKKWTLLDCVQYAMANNLSVKQTELQTKNAELTYDQSKMGRWPSLLPCRRRF